MAIPVSVILRRARNASGLTQAELARRLETTQSAVARLEGPRSNPTVLTLERALDAAGYRLELAALRDGPSVDLDQIASDLRLTPAERLAKHAASHENLRKLVESATRPDGTVD